MNSENKSNEFYRKLTVEKFSEIAKSRRVSKDDLYIVKNYSDKSHKVLDLACGDGRLTIPLKMKGYDIRGVDLSPYLIKKAKIKAKDKRVKIDFKVGNMKDLPYNANSFDRIFCMWSSFNHLLNKKEQIKCINEVYRVLKKDGLAFFEMLNGDKKSTKNKLEKTGEGRDKKILPEYIEGILNEYYMHDKESLNEICDKSKFNDYDIKFKNLHGKRRLTMILRK